MCVMRLLCPPATREQGLGQDSVLTGLHVSSWAAEELGGLKAGETDPLALLVKIVTSVAETST